MKKRILSVLMLALSVGALSGITYARLVACVGDSNTFGEGLLDRTNDCYPARLQALLRQAGPDWEVRNFGYSGATVLAPGRGDIPYISQGVYRQALDSKPDIVVLCFGPNASRSENYGPSPSKSQNRAYIQEFYASDYTDLIDAFAALPSRPKIVICHPLKAFSEAWSINDAIIKNQIIPIIAKIAYDRRLPTVDFYSAFEHSPNLYQPDGIHPTPAGTSLMAERVAASLLAAPDLNGDGVVDTEDLLRLIPSWGQDDPLADMAPVFGNGVVDGGDLELLMSYWGQSVDDPTLVAHWALDEIQGDTARDGDGGNDADVIGGPAWQANGGQVGGAIQLDGVDDVVIAGPIPNLGSGPFSVLAWVKGGPAGRTILSAQAGANWLSADLPGGLLKTELTGVGQQGRPLLSGTTVTDGLWHRVGLVWNGSKRMLYVDGVVVAEDAQDGMDVEGTRLNIGCGKDMGPGTYWSGLIDDVRIYGRVVRP